MIKINLLPYREKEKKENLARQISIIAGSFVIFILLLVFVQFKFSSSVSRLEDQVKETEAKLIELNKKIGDLERFKKDKKELEQKLGVIKTLEENRLAPKGSQIATDWPRMASIGQNVTSFLLTWRLP